MQKNIKPVKITKANSAKQIIIDGLMKESHWYNIYYDTYEFRWDAIVNGEHRTVFMHDSCYPILTLDDPKIAEYRLLAKEVFLNDAKTADLDRFKASSDQQQ